MSSFLSTTVIFFFLAAGMAAAVLKLVPRGKWVSAVLNLTLYILLFFMGMRMGGSSEVWKALYSIGFISAVFAAVTAAGTAMATVILYRVFRLNRGSIFIASASETDEILNEKSASQNDCRIKSYTDGNVKGFSEKAKAFFSHIRAPLGLASFVVLGFAAGAIINKTQPAGGFTGEALSSWILNFLLFMVGIQLVNNNVNLKEALSRKDTIILPLGAAAGSLAGGLLAAPFFGLTPGKALALASGFGWYSLSGVIISDMGDPVLGSAGFLINMFREGIALMTIPFLAGTRYPGTGIGVAGATSMDVALPLIEKSCGDSAVPLALANGAILSMAVPVLVPLFFSLG